MSANDAILELLREALAGRAQIVGKRMFGGVGVYLDGTFFAILDDGVPYFKTSETSRSRYQREGSVVFTYSMKSGTGTLATYWRVPDRLFDELDELAQWALEAAAAKSSAPDKISRRASRKPARARSR